MTIYFYQAECGDAGRMRFIGSDNKPHNIFIDAGYERTFRHVLAGEINAIAKAGESIDAWIVSHIHDDHIGGVMTYLRTIGDGEFPDIVTTWLYNPPRISPADRKPLPANPVSLPKSIDQGDKLVRYLLSKNKLISTDITGSNPPFNFFGLKLTVLSPDNNALRKLRAKYPPDSDIPYEQNEIDSISAAKAAKQFDYDIPATAFNFSSFEQDKSIENASSIAFLAECNEKKILWLADAHPNILINSLRQLGYSENNPLVCDWVKVTHHGSSGNNSSQLYELIRCNNYLFSANAENIHYLPSKECLVRILSNPKRNDNKYHFYFTYDNPLLRSIFTVDGENVFTNYNFEVHYLDGPENYLSFTL